uniref:Uncharacterized protein n=1 Tax=Meloidogyne javanica TaxID=6303 RepID=A0A915LW73_MELJA
MQKMTEIADLSKEMKNLKIYKGRNDARTFSSFINAYNKVATAYGWTEMEMARMFPIFLSKDAQFFYDNLSLADKSNWGNLIDKMARKFAIGESVSYFRRLASTRRQGVNESISEFSEAISQLVDKGYPDSGGFSEEIRRGLAIEFFRNGLRLELREQLRKMQKPKTMPEATLQAMEEEEALQELAREKIENAQLEKINQISLTVQENDDFDYEGENSDYEGEDLDYEDLDYESGDFDYECEDFDYEGGDFDYEGFERGMY